MPYRRSILPSKRSSVLTSFQLLKVSWSSTYVSPLPLDLYSRLPDFLTEVTPVPCSDPRSLKISDLNVEDHHRVTPDFWNMAGKTGMQPTMIPTEISTVLVTQVGMDNNLLVTESLQNDKSGNKIPGDVGGSGRDLESVHQTNDAHGNCKSPRS